MQQHNEVKKVALNFLKKLKEGLGKTKQSFTEKIEGIISSHKAVDEELFEELEEALITADIGVSTSMEIIDDLRTEVKRRRVNDPHEVRQVLKEIILNIFNDIPEHKDYNPKVIVVVGVNGVGKTTTIGKLAFQFISEGKKVILAAADTFRAAAIEQLEIWSHKTGAEIVKHSEGSDPAAVIYDSLRSLKARGFDLLICDTAGRLHTKKNLMEELKKVFRVVEREYSHEEICTFLVLDATTGQNALNQAKVFAEAITVDGIILTKLDGTAKGGIVVAIADVLKTPVYYIGIGEGMDDLQPFNPESFVEVLF
jgi:fused signal recognition particle receptor